MKFPCLIKCPSLQTLAGFNDVEHFCDVVDALEEQGIEKCMDVS